MLLHPITIFIVHHKATQEHLLRASPTSQSKAAKESNTDEFLELGLHATVKLFQTYSKVKC